MKKAFWISMGIIVIQFIACIFLYSTLPEQIPTHWNAHGEIDSYGPRWTIFMLTAISLVVLTLLYFVPKMDPKGKNILDSGRIVPLMMVTLTVLFALLFVVTVLASLGYNVAINTVVPAAVGVLFILIGNYMPKIKPNYMMGIRLPWTLADEGVWHKTHRLGGKVFMFGGLAFVIATFLPAPINFIFPLVILLGGIFWTGVYSFLELKKVKKTSADAEK